MIGVIGLSERAFNTIYQHNKNYFCISLDTGNCIGRKFDAIISYVPLEIIEPEILANLYTRLTCPPMIIHEISNFKRAFK